MKKKCDVILGTYLVLTCLSMVIYAFSGQAIWSPLNDSHDFRGSVLVILHVLGIVIPIFYLGLIRCDMENT